MILYFTVIFIREPQVQDLFDTSVYDGNTGFNS